MSPFYNPKWDYIAQSSSSQYKKCETLIASHSNNYIRKLQIVHPFTFYLNSNLTSNRAEECNTHSTPDCHHGGHNLPSKPPPELLIPHTPSISYLTDPNSTRIIIFLALPSNLPPREARSFCKHCTWRLSTCQFRFFGGKSAFYFAATVLV